MYVAGTQGLTISEIVPREIDPVLFILLLTTDNFPLQLLNGTFPVGTGGGA